MNPCQINSSCVQLVPGCYKITKYRECKIVPAPGIMLTHVMGFKHIDRIIYTRNITVRLGTLHNNYDIFGVSHNIDWIRSNNLVIYLTSKILWYMLNMIHISRIHIQCTTKQNDLYGCKRRGKKIVNNVSRTNLFIHMTFIYRSTAGLGSFLKMLDVKLIKTKRLKVIH